MTYNPINFNNGKAGGTPVSASNLRHVENGIVAAHNDIAALTANVNSLSERYGTPLVAHTAAEMTDNTKIYVYVGSETGYTTGDWYYYDGDSWESGGAYNSTAVNTDKTLTQEDMAADAKKTGDEISDLKSAISDIEEQIEGGTGSGLTEEVKQALLNAFNHVLWDDDDPTGQTYIDDLYDSLYAITAISITPTSMSFSTLSSTQQLTATTTPEGGNVTWSSADTSVATVDSTGLVTAVGYGSAVITATAGSVTATSSVLVAQATVTSISAVYTQSGTVYDTDSIEDLRNDLVVTANYSDSTSATVTTYALSGTLTEGTSTITVSYGGKTTTFNVTVTHDVGRSDMDGWTDGIPYTILEIVNNSYVKKNDGGIATYSGWNRTGFVPCDGALNIIIPPFTGSADTDAGEYNWFYDSSKNPVSKITASKTDRTIISVPSTANYFVLSQASAVLNNVLNGEIVPNGQAGNWTDGVAYDVTKYSPVLANMYINKTNGSAQSSSGWEVLEYVDCEGASTLTFSSNISVDLNYCVFYTSAGAFAGTFESNKSSATVINVPSTASYFRLSAENAKMAQIIDGTVTVTPSA